MDLGQYKEVVYQIIGSAMNVYAELRYGLLEPVYQEALSWELEQRGIPNKREQEIEIFYKEHRLEKKWRSRQTLWGSCTDANPKLLLNDT